MSPNYKNIIETVEEILSVVGFEIHPFKIGWYNEQVLEKFRFSYSPETLGLLVVSTPDLFDNGLLPYIQKQECLGTTDPLDGCIKEEFAKVLQAFPDHDVEAIHDFELLPSRRPKILVQTAGHVSGAAYYYQRKDVQPDSWPEKTKIFGVSIHPKYGGWFALRGVFIFRDVECPDLPQKQPVDIVPDMAQRQELLERFNFRWQDWTFRDIIEVDKKYSDAQKQYFATAPKNRFDLLKKFKDGVNVAEKSD